MNEKTMPAPRYSIWQSIAVCLNLATRALEEARAAREPGPPGEPGIPGPPGEPPYLGEVCGLFDAKRSYRKFDLVTLNGSEWRARVDEPGVLPGAGWALAGQSGSRGKQGERGERGLPGPTIAGWETRDFVAVPVLSDGSRGPPLDLRTFFEIYHAEAAE